MAGINALGDTVSAMREAWAQNRAPGMRRLPEGLRLTSGKTPFYGFAVGDLAPLPPDPPREHMSRNNQLLWTGLARDEDTWKGLLASVAPNRVAVVLGTSTSGSQEALAWVKGANPAWAASPTPYALTTEPFSGWAQEMGDPARFLARTLGLTGPAYVVSTACTSSARALISGARLIEAGLVDAAIVGGVDTLAQMPLNGFDALGVLATDLTQPLSRDRAGITIGEAMGLLWLERAPDGASPSEGLYLLGWGESSDAYHMSSPDPEGRGVEAALRHALAHTGLAPEAIDYVNLHGTGTRQNDSAECQAIARVLGDKAWVSSTKALTGHTLGAAGITDALLTLGLLEAGGGVLPGQFDPVWGVKGVISPAGSVWDDTLAPVRYIERPTTIAARVAVSTNVAFGGNNTALVFGCA